MPVKNSRKAQIAARIRAAGKRARAEADARRATRKPAEMPQEVDGPRRPEPTRYGDWERKGIASDF